MSVTAFPVLVRIATEWNLQRTLEGSLVVASAAVDNALAWTLLAVVVVFASGRRRGPRGDGEFPRKIAQVAHNLRKSVPIDG